MRKKGEEKDGTKISAFEKMVVSMSVRGSEQQLEQVSGKVDTADRSGTGTSAAASMQRRYEILARGFYQSLSAEEVNAQLLQAGCEQLYARSRTEASLLFAYEKKLPFERWKELYRKMNDRYEQEYSSCVGAGAKTTPRDLLRYISGESEVDRPGETLHRTLFLQKEIENLPKDEKRFLEYLDLNESLFSTVREKARYYFCKYLYGYLTSRIHDCATALEAGAEKEKALSLLVGIKGATRLKRGQVSREEVGEYLMDCAISCGDIYDAMNFFFFDYVSTDWVEVLLEYYGNLNKLDEEDAAYLAEALRAWRREWKDLSDSEVLAAKQQEIEAENLELDQVYALDGTDKGYQRNRSGEKSIRNYLTGAVDVDRTSLLCYLLFFHQNIHYSLFREQERSAHQVKMQSVDRARLDGILRECGFPILRWEDDFDHFVIEYLIHESPEEYLMNTVSMYALDNENFYLYHMYNRSVSNSAQTRKWLT